MLKAAGAGDCQRMRIGLEKEPDTFPRNGTVYQICEKIFFDVTIVETVKDCKEKLQFFFYAQARARENKPLIRCKGLAASRENLLCPMVSPFKTGISQNSV